MTPGSDSHFDQRSLDMVMDQQHSEDTDKGPRFAVFIIRLYRRWGYFIVDYDWIAILACLVISLIGFALVFITP